MTEPKTISGLMTRVMEEAKKGNPNNAIIYLDEAIELANELGIEITDHEIIRTNSTGLVIYNPKNLAERIKGMKNKNISREDKIKARLLYEANQGQSEVVN